jgi:glycosyltransferase involved in cell wall biosynthesis
MGHFLSFILPCYNYADILEECLSSIYQQNLCVPFEVICTDDNSSDKRTVEILKRWENSHDNFRLQLRTFTGGECVANNDSIRLAQGDIFFCLDTDNILEPNSVQLLINHLDKTGCEGACFQKLYFFKKENNSRKRTSTWVFDVPNNVVDIHHITKTGMTPAASGNYLFTRESYNRAGGYPEGNVMGSWSFGFRQHATGCRIAVLPDTFYWHRFSEGGMYLTNQKKGLNAKAIIQTVLEFKHIFTPETQKLLETEECQKDFLGFCLKGMVKVQ